MIRLQRVYEEHGPGARAGTRFLVDRLWPRGRKKADLHLDGWPREVGPSTELRRWFAHDVARWDEFRRRYTRELDAHPDVWEPLLEAARLLTSTRSSRSDGILGRCRDQSPQLRLDHGIGPYDFGTEQPR